MVQSIFDEREENAHSRRARTDPQPRYDADDPFGFGDTAPSTTPAPQYFEPPPPDPIIEPPPTQLDGLQRVEPFYEDRSLYDDDWRRPDVYGDDVRRSGLAWSAGVVFFGSVAFMLFVGWGADLLLGSSPWGLVLGIVFGSVIGFIQFFRISSQIYRPKKDGPDVSPLMSAPPEEEDRDRWV